MSHLLALQACLTLEEVHGGTLERRRFRFLNAEENMEEAYLPICGGDTLGDTLHHGKTMYDEFQGL